MGMRVSTATVQLVRVVHCVRYTARGRVFRSGTELDVTLGRPVIRASG